MPDREMPDREMPDRKMPVGEVADRKMTDQELLSAYLDGELPPPVARGVEDRLASDPALRREHFRLQQVSAVLRVRCEADLGFVVRHRERRDDLSPVLRWTWRELGFRLTAVAAALLVAAALSVWQAARPEPDTLADTAAAVEELDLLAFEGEILAAPEFATLAESDPAEEPVLVIALGVGFSPTGGR